MSAHAEEVMQGPKTQEQQLRILENKPSVPDARQMDAVLGANNPPSPRLQNPQARQSEFPVSRHGVNQESDHNKHNDPGQSGHKPQKHSEAEEKQD
jgi:hypothetical protein